MYNVIIYYLYILFIYIFIYTFIYIKIMNAYFVINHEIKLK